jgi:uncharacterized protein (TIGR03435 family)
MLGGDAYGIQAEAASVHFLEGLKGFGWAAGFEEDGNEFVPSVFDAAAGTDAGFFEVDDRASEIFAKIVAAGESWQGPPRSYWAWAGRARQKRVARGRRVSMEDLPTTSVSRRSKGIIDPARIVVMKMLLRWTIVVFAMCAVAADQPKFEAASVKRTDRGVITNSMGPGTVVLKGDTLKIVLAEAFQVKGYQIAGPSWLDEDCFEIIAKMPEGAASDQIPAMLQVLLAERFKLAAHKENRPRPVYALVVEKSGPKFKEADLNFRRTGPRPGEVKFRSGPDARGFKGSMTMAALVHFLSNSVDRPVQDFTGLKGTYDIDLSWAPDRGIDRPSSSAVPADPGGELPTAPTATVFTAIRDSLGLRLEARNEPVEMLVIDHVERVPIEN